MKTNRHLRSIIIFVLAFVISFAGLMPVGASYVYASDLPSDYNSKMVKAYGGYGNLYTMMMAAYGPNTYNKFYKPATSSSDGWRFTYYWNDPSNGNSSRKWGSYEAMKAAGVLPMAGDIIVFCNGEDIATNSYGDSVSLTHVGVVVTDTDANGVYYTMEGNYRGSKAVVFNKRTIAGSYTNYSRMNIDPYDITAHYKIYAIVHNTSDEVRNLVAQTAYYEKTKYDSNVSAYRTQIARDMQYDGEWCVGFGARVALEHPTIGYLNFRATTPVPRLAGTFEGAEYMVYRDEACTIPAGPVSMITFTVDDSGYADKTIVLAPGTYYVKQTKAPLSGNFINNTGISAVTVTANRTQTVSGGNMIQLPKTLKAYFVGNSYTNRNGLPSLVSELFKNSGITLQTTMYAIDDSYLYQHVQNATVKKEISSGDYDFVILQEESHDVREKTQDSVNYVKTMMGWAPSSTHFYLYQTMSYQGEPEKQTEFTNAYNTISKATGATVIPAGEAFWAYAKANPSANMFADWQHPSYTGSTVVAQSMYDTIMKDTIIIALQAAESSVNSSVSLSDNTNIPATSTSAGANSGTGQKEIAEGKNGDVNGDGVIDPRDYVIIKNHILKTKVITDETILKAADVNGDGTIDPRDYVRVKNIILGR